MLTAQRNNKDVELGEAVMKAFFRAIFCSQNVKEWRRLIVKKELSSAEAKIQIRAGVELTSDDLFGTAVRHHQMFSGVVDENLAVPVKRYEAKGQQSIGRDFATEYDRVLKVPSHNNEAYSVSKVACTDRLSKWLRKSRTRLSLGDAPEGSAKLTVIPVSSLFKTATDRRGRYSCIARWRHDSR